MLLLSAAVFTASHGSAQINFNYGNVTNDEIKLKECAFEPEATAAVLVDEGYCDYTSYYELMTFCHRRVKILKEAGKDYGEVSLVFRSDDALESIDQVNAMTINYDESGSRTDLVVDRKSIYTRKINKYFSEVTFAFPGVRVGSILEYSYRIMAKHYGMLRDWTFQSGLPVYRSSFELKVIPTREISYLVQYNPAYGVKAEPNKMTNSVFFEMKNLPSLTDEPYMDAKQDYIQKVIFQTTRYATSFGTQNSMRSWNDVAKELYARNDFGRQIKINIDECSDYVKSLSGKSDYEKMRLIHRFVINNTSWNGRHGIITSDGVKTLWKNKTGTAAEINLLLIGMLQDAGLTAYPMLVSERGNGRINKTTPFIDQFNNVYAAVTIGDNQYYLDGTDRYTPSYLTPYSILNSSAFIVNNRNGGLVDIQENTARYKDVVAIEASIAPDGQLHGAVRLQSSDYARAYWLSRLKEQKREKYITDDLLHGMSNVTVDSVQVSNQEEDTLPLKQAFDFTTAVQTTGDYAFINLNMFTGYESNPFIVNNRFSRVNFGYNKSLTENFLVHIPENMKIDALPQNVRLTTPDGSVVFSREVFLDEETHKLLARMKVDINKSLFEVDKYADLKEFYKKMIGLMNEQVVLKRI
jgi:hypothetical protein